VNRFVEKWIGFSSLTGNRTVFGLKLLGFGYCRALGLIIDLGQQGIGKAVLGIHFHDALKGIV